VLEKTKRKKETITPGSTSIFQSGQTLRHRKSSWHCHCRPSCRSSGEERRQGRGSALCCWNQADDRVRGESACKSRKCRRRNTFYTPPSVETGNRKCHYSIRSAVMSDQHLGACIRQRQSLPSIDWDICCNWSTPTRESCKWALQCAPLHTAA
jgi:hypothetical protein